MNEREKPGKRKKYGLVWEEEKFEKETAGKLPVVIEDKKKEIKTDSEKPENILLNGIIIMYSPHSIIRIIKSIDLIYIDPSCNTGNKDFTYNDEFIEKEDTCRHNKWLSFMNKRLKPARTYLKNSGVIFISMDDNGQADLKLLCDDIFGENNFVAHN